LLIERTGERVSNKKGEKGSRRGRSGPGGVEPIRHTLVDWNDDGLAFHAGSGQPVTGEVVKRWTAGLSTTEGLYVDGIRQGFGHRYYSPGGRALAHREADERVRITTRYEGGRLVERRARTGAGELAWLERWDSAGAPLPTPAPPPLREALASPDPATAHSARRTVLDLGEQLRHRIQELDAALERHRLMRNDLRELQRPTDAQKARIRWHKVAEIDLDPLPIRARDELNALQAWYRGWVPRIPVARCPHTDQVAAFPIDTVDLDGWFWEYERPVRPYHWNELPLTWLAMTGAIQLREPLASAPFEARPGPEVPYVIPRILNHRDDVRAVINQVPVGPHTGWAITYFTLKQIHAKLVSTWGQATYHWRSDDGEWHWEDGGWTSQYFDFRYGDNDYDLAPWLRSGKLLWIAPGDQGLILRTGEAGCPYTDIAGSRHMSHIRHGQIRRTGP
jgi:hypothetical protein